MKISNWTPILVIKIIMLKNRENFLPIKAPLILKATMIIIYLIKVK